MSRVETRINDYLGMGVRVVWTAAEGLREVKSGVLTVAEPAIEMPLSAVC